MDTLILAFPVRAKESPEPMPIHTTLYDLIAAISVEAGPDEEDVTTAVVGHLLNTHRVTCTGDLQGYRLVCDGTESAA